MFLNKAVAQALCFGLLTVGIVPVKVFAADSPTQKLSRNALSFTDAAAVALSEVERPGRTSSAVRANLGGQSASRDTQLVADWVMDSGDNEGMPFVIVDKVDAKVFVFDEGGHLLGATSALLGLALGDQSVPGIGKRKLATIRPDERTTPSGRFVAYLDRNMKDGEILWVDYEAAISLHPVVTTVPKEHRLERLGSSDPLARRISYGCINVPAQFYRRIVSKAFKGTFGIVYVLPEVRSIRDVFGSYDVPNLDRSTSIGKNLPK